MFGLEGLEEALRTLGAVLETRHLSYRLLPELLDAARWAITHDPSPGFRGLLVQTVQAFGVEVTDASF